MESKERRARSRTDGNSGIFTLLEAAIAVERAKIGIYISINNTNQPTAALDFIMGRGATAGFFFFLF
jgi:hypothetical protein